MATAVFISMLYRLKLAPAPASFPYPSESKLLPNSALAPSPFPSFKTDVTSTLPLVVMETPSMHAVWLALKIATTVLEVIFTILTEILGVWVSALAVAVPSAFTLTEPAVRVPFPVSAAWALEAASARARFTPIDANESCTPPAEGVTSAVALVVYKVSMVTAPAVTVLFCGILRAATNVAWE